MQPWKPSWAQNEFPHEQSGACCSQDMCRAAGCSQDVPAAVLEMFSISKDCPIPRKAIAFWCRERSLSLIFCCAGLLQLLQLGAVIVAIELSPQEAGRICWWTHPADSASIWQHPSGLLLLGLLSSFPYQPGTHSPLLSLESRFCHPVFAEGLLFPELCLYQYSFKVI